jgi:ribosomal protein S18 acetylase RimI-like enzyme
MELGAEVERDLAAYVRRLVLRDGREVVVRPVRPDDAAEIGRAILEGDPETLRARFLGTAPRPTERLLAVLTRLDLVDHFALIAHAEDGEGVGLARYGVMAEDEDAGAASRTAEVAVVVRPGWRRVGLGDALIAMLGERAQECGLTTFSAVYWAENEPVSRWVRGLGATVSVDQGVAQMRLELPSHR